MVKDKIDCSLEPVYNIDVCAYNVLIQSETEKAEKFNGPAEGASVIVKLLSIQRVYLCTRYCPILSYALSGNKKLGYGV